MPTHNDPPQPEKEGTQVNETDQRRRAFEDKKKHLEAKIANLKKLSREQGAEGIRRTEIELKNVEDSLKGLKSE